MMDWDSGALLPPRRWREVAARRFQRGRPRKPGSPISLPGKLELPTPRLTASRSNHLG